MLSSHIIRVDASRGLNWGPNVSQYLLAGKGLAAPATLPEGFMDSQNYRAQPLILRPDQPSPSADLQCSLPMPYKPCHIYGPET